MLQVTQNAVLLLDATKRQRQIPEEFGIRVSGVPNSEGTLDIHIGFAPEPVEDDSVTEQYGQRLFVAPELVETLADAELDVAVNATSDGGGGAQLVLRPQQHPDLF